MREYDKSPKPLSRTLGSSGKPKSVVSPAEWLQRSAEPVAFPFSLFASGYPRGRSLNTPGVVQREKVKVKNKPEETIETEDYEVGQLDIDCIIGGTKQSLAMLEPKEPSMTSEVSLLAAGMLPGITGTDLSEPGDIYYVDGKMVADYWETEPEEEDELSTQGSYSEKRGFHRIGEPNERLNCAGYALDIPEFMEPSAAHNLLKDTSLFVPTEFKAMETGKEYILAYQYHFMKVIKMGDDKYVTREKNGISGAYEKIYKEADFISQRLSSLSSSLLYSKKSSI